MLLNEVEGQDGEGVDGQPEEEAEEAADVREEVGPAVQVVVAEYLGVALQLDRVGGVEEWKCFKFSYSYLLLRNFFCHAKLSDILCF